MYTPLKRPLPTKPDVVTPHFDDVDKVSVNQQEQILGAAGSEGLKAWHSKQRDSEGSGRLSLQSLLHS